MFTVMVCPVCHYTIFCDVAIINITVPKEREFYKQLDRFIPSHVFPHFFFNPLHTYLDVYTYT